MTIMLNLIVYNPWQNMGEVVVQQDGRKRVVCRELVK